MVFSKASRFAATYCLKRTTMKTVFIPLVLLAMASAAVANTAPTVVIQSAAMRPGTTLMDVVYRVNDPDDATVKTRALAFVDGVRSFAKVIRPVTFVEGTAAKLGDAIPSNTDHTLTWDVATDWNIDLGQVKFEVLAMDGRGLLPFDWITIPAAGGNPTLTISENVPRDDDTMDGLFWLYALGDAGLTLSDGVLRGTSASGAFEGIVLANTEAPYFHGSCYLMKRMNLDPATLTEEAYAGKALRREFRVPKRGFVVNRPYTGVFTINGQLPAAANDYDPRGVIDIYDLNGVGFLLDRDGTVARWGVAPIMESNGVTHIMPPGVPDGLIQIKSIGIGTNYGIALKNDGSVVGWGVDNDNIPIAQTTQSYPSDFKELATTSHAFALLRNNGSVMVGGSVIIFFYWGMPSGGVNSLSASGFGDYAHFMALLDNGNVHGWGFSYRYWDPLPPFASISPGPIPGITGATATACGTKHVLALKADGTVAMWGESPGTDVPAGLSDVVAIAASNYGGYAWKADGSVTTWGDAIQATNLSEVKLIETGGQYRLLGRKSDM